MLGDPVGAHTGHGCADQRRALQRVFDFGKLDAVAANLDLGIGPAKEFDRAIGAIAGQIAGAVEPFGKTGREGVAQELLRGQLGGIQ